MFTCLRIVHMVNAVYYQLITAPDIVIMCCRKKKVHGVATIDGLGKRKGTMKKSKSYVDLLVH